MNGEEEKRIETELIEKMKNRLDRIRAKLGITYDYTTYDSLTILEEVGREVRMIQIGQERKQNMIQRKTSFPSPKQRKLINDLRQKAGEPLMKDDEFKTYQEVDSEIKRLKSKIGM